MSVIVKQQIKNPLKVETGLQNSINCLVSDLEYMTDGDNIWVYLTIRIVMAILLALCFIPLSVLWWTQHTNAVIALELDSLFQA